MDVQLPDGTLLKGIPDGTTKSQIAQKLKSSGHAVPDEWMTPATPARTPGEGYSALERADTAASLVSGAVAPLAGGLVNATGYARQGIERYFTGHDPGDATAAAAKIESALTYNPRTDTGKKVMADVHKGMQAFEDWSDKQGAQATTAVLAAGTKAAEVAKSMGAPQSVVDFIDRHKDQVAAAYGSATKTAINAAPLALGGELTKLPGRAGEVAGRGEVPAPAPVAAAPPPTELSLAPSTPRPVPGAPAAPAPAAPLEVAPTSPRGTPSTVGEGPLPATPAPAAPTTPTARAQAYVRDRLGLSWDALADRTKQKLTNVAHNAQALDNLPAEAVKRQAKLEALPVPIKTTAGRLNRDNTQLLKEEGAMVTKSGKSIENIDIEANRGIRANVDFLIDKLRGVGQSRVGAMRGEQIGEVIAGRSAETPGIVTKRQRQAQAATKKAYQEARKTDPDAKVPADPMYEFVRGEPDVLNPMTQHVGWLRNWLKKAGIEKLDEAGNPTGDRRPISAVELDDLRQLAGEHAGTGDTPGHYAGKVLGVIDQMFDEGLPESAGKWKAARDLHRTERTEFANQGSIDRLVGTKGGHFGTDPKTALEDVWKVSIQNAKIEEVRQLKRSLLGGKDQATRLQGKQALRAVRAATAQNFLEEITKGISTNAAAEVNITPDSINRWIRSVGNDGTVEGGVEKLNVVWGRRATRMLMDIREAAQITKTAPTTRTSGSNTFSRILNWIDDTGLGDTVKGIAGTPIKMAEAAWKAGEGGRIARSAEKDATYAGEKAGTAARLREGAALLKQRDEAERKRPKPPTYGDRE